MREVKLEDTQAAWHRIASKCVLRLKAETRLSQYGTNSISEAAKRSAFFIQPEAQKILSINWNEAS